METANNNRIWGLAIAAFIFVMDQFVKFLVTGPLGLNELGANMQLLPFFDLTFAKNYGVSMGLLTADSEWQRWLLVALTGVIACVVLVWMWREKERGDIWALALVLGGALGNIVDRARLGYVVDYADFHIGDFRPFLIFNVADAAITIGVVILLARVLFIGEKDKESAGAENKLENENA
ncbi:signal peptidase II [Sphingorhabdus sp. Alg239-R122]|uniref:signal peptidase II n=1 Tax=Sphingorhabdus sp. Alg239-R122 TaxID=2305989 RepID=UPI0013DBB393|nr:signal peptidase II [Sphingorhabdus sp. Alg239-R122]